MNDSVDLEGLGRKLMGEMALKRLELDTIKQWAEADPSPEEVKYRLHRWLQEDIDLNLGPRKGPYRDNPQNTIEGVEAIRKAIITLSVVPCINEIADWVIEHVPRYATGLALNDHLSPENIKKLRDWARGEIGAFRSQYGKDYIRKGRLERAGRALGALSKRGEVAEETIDELLHRIAPEGDYMPEGPFSEDEYEKHWKLWDKVVQQLHFEPEKLLEAWRRVDNPEGAARLLFKHDQMTPRLLAQAGREELALEVAQELLRNTKFQKNPEVRDVFQGYQDPKIHLLLVGEAEPGQATNELLCELADLSQPYLGAAMDRLSSKQKNQMDRKTLETLLQSSRASVREVALRASGQNPRQR